MLLERRLIPRIHISQAWMASEITFGNVRDNARLLEVILANHFRRIGGLQCQAIHHIRDLPIFCSEPKLRFRFVP